MLRALSSMFFRGHDADVTGAPYLESVNGDVVFPVADFYRGPNHVYRYGADVYFRKDTSRQWQGLMGCYSPSARGHNRWYISKEGVSGRNFQFAVLNMYDSYTTFNDFASITTEGKHGYVTWDADAENGTATVESGDYSFSWYDIDVGEATGNALKGGIFGTFDYSYEGDPEPVCNNFAPSGSRIYHFYMEVDGVRVHDMRPMPGGYLHDSVTGEDVYPENGAQVEYGIQMPHVIDDSAPGDRFFIFNYKGTRNRSVYFDTGVVPGGDTRFDVCIKRPSNPALEAGWQTGCRTGWVSGAFMVNVGSTIEYNTWFIRNSSYLYDPHGTGLPASVWNDNSIVCSIRNGGGGQAFVDDVLKAEQSEPFSGSSMNTIFIGDVNENGTPKGGTDSQGTMMLFWAKIYEADVLTHHYVPKIDEDGSPYLLDIVTGHMLSPNGSAKLAYGSLYNGVETIIVDGSSSSSGGGNSVYRYDIDWDMYEPVNSGDVCGTYDGDTSSDVTITLSDEYGGGTIHMYFNADWGYWDVSFDGNGYAYEWGYGVFYLYDYDTGQELYFGFGE